MKCLQVYGGTGSGTFSEEVKNLKSGEKYFARAYALNAEGIAYGASERFVTGDAEEPLFIEGAEALDGSQGWWQSAWLGSFYESQHDGWLLHERLGWLFAVPDPEEGVWFWKEGLEWIWTDNGVYPYFHAEESAGWLFFHGEDDDNCLLYNYEAEKWIIIGK